MIHALVCPACGYVAETDNHPFCPRDGHALGSPESERIVGASIKGYRVLRLLGIGGMGAVYLVEHATLGKRALKLIRAADMPGLSRDDQLQRFAREIFIQAQVIHPNVATLHHTDITDAGDPFLVMEFVEGVPLSSLLHQHHFLPPPRVLGIVEQVAQGLYAAHVLSIVHRDLKPSNILISNDRNGLDVVKLVDFGIAKARHSTNITVLGASVGTPGYMSPEQASGGTVDHRSDIYSLALVTFEVLTGAQAFAGDSARDIIVKHIENTPSPLSTCRPDIVWPATLQSVLDRALATEPSERYQSSLLFSQALAEALGATTQSTAALGLATTIPLSVSRSSARDRVNPAVGIDSLPSSYTPALPSHRRIAGLSHNNLPGWKGPHSSTLFGREEELQALTTALHDPSCSIVCVIAAGGYGKSALVTRWLETLRDLPRPGAFANAVQGFAYSFYKQGWEGSSGISSASFFAECLTALTGAPAADVPKEGIQRWARDILTSLQSANSLLLLDGLEPHQSPLGSDAEGEILDKTLKEFVRGIVLPSGGLCVITSRIMPPELTGPPMETGRVRVIRLGALSLDASIRVLQSAGVTSPDPALGKWANASHGHPLLLALLAPRILSGYEFRAFESHRVLNDIPKTIRNVVLSHLQLLDPAASAVLSSMSMFDRAVSADELQQSLLERALIPGVTDSLYVKRSLLRRPAFSAVRFARGVELLEKAAMITKIGADQSPTSWILEPHPIVQAGVRAHIIDNWPDSWRKANWTIYSALLRSVRATTPDNRADLARLYSAIPHGVNAGRGGQAGWMYAKRCLRNFRAYSTTVHGMIEDDISALSHYFEGNWKTLKEDIGLDQYAQTQANVWSGTLLTAVNRWAEGRPLMERGLALAIQTGNYTTAARTARNLGLGYAIAGELQLAESSIRHSIELLTKRRSLRSFVYDSRLEIVPFHRMASAATLGQILHFQGRFEEAERAFSQAAGHLRKATGFHTLRGEWCFRQVELMLDQRKFETAERLIANALDNPEAPEGWNEGIFALPILRLALVRTRVRQADASGIKTDWPDVLSSAAALARIGEQNQLRMDWLIPLVKISLASIARLQGDVGSAAAPLDEAERWVTRSGNRLFEADVCIERARLSMASGNRQQAAVWIKDAASVSRHIGYNCRTEEIAGLAMDTR